MTIRIVTDSTCDLPKEILQEYGITVVPLYIHADSQVYQDGVDLTRNEFYKRLPGYKTSPTTAAPGPELFRQAYEHLAAEGATEILSIHISIKLSATVDSAHLAARETTVVPVTVFDSRQLSLGTGFQILTAIQAVKDGRSMSDILSLLENQIPRTYVFAALDTLEFMRRSGRMNFALSSLGTLMQIKPILTMYDGEPGAERVRTRRSAMNRLVELYKTYGPYQHVSLVHSHALERAKILKQEVESLLPAGEIMIEEINPVLGTHVGPGVVGFVVVSKTHSSGW